MITYYVEVKGMGWCFETWIFATYMMRNLVLIYNLQKKLNFVDFPVMSAIFTDGRLLYLKNPKNLNKTT